MNAAPASPAVIASPRPVAQTVIKTRAIGIIPWRTTAELTGSLHDLMITAPGEWDEPIVMDIHCAEVEAINVARGLRSRRDWRYAVACALLREHTVRLGWNPMYRA